MVVRIIQGLGLCQVCMQYAAMSLIALICNHPDQPWHQLSLLYNEYQGSFPGVQRPKCHFTTHADLLLRLTLRRLMSYIYAAPILDVSRSHTTTQHSR